MSRPVAVALMPSERELLTRAVTELLEREDSPQAEGVLVMLVNSLDVGAVAALARDGEEW